MNLMVITHQLFMGSALKALEGDADATQKNSRFDGSL